MTELEYDYLAPSVLERAADGEGARLALATSGGSTLVGAAKHPFFFAGFVEHPVVIAQALLALARVARTRFYVPPNTLAAVLRAADPVVTSTPAGLRFEAFSVCCGVYARLDVDATAFDILHSDVGVTNVDVNPPLRQALATLRTNEQLHLAVGEDALRVRTARGEVVEHKVPLPVRWLKGFAETQSLSAGMGLVHHLNAAEARQFVQVLPRSSSTKAVMWAAQASRALRLASRPAPQAVCVAGPERLRVLEPLLRHVTELRAYGPKADAVSAPLASFWEMRLPGARFWVGLSPEKSRGFSGEGSVLHALSGSRVVDDADLVSSLLSFDQRIDVKALAASIGMQRERVLDALSLLASSGRVGYDLAADAYFHRPLPVRADALSALHPRLVDAHDLVASGHVAVDGVLRRVTSESTVYEVRLGRVAHDDRCTCPWFARHRSSRGPCKHVLAARIDAERKTS